MIGVPIKLPKIPPFEIVKVPPAMSSVPIFPSFPLFARRMSVLNIYEASYFLNIGETEAFTVSDHRHHEAWWCRHSDGYIDVITVNNFVPVDHSINNRLLFETWDRCFHEEWDEPKLNIVLLLKIFLHWLSGLHYSTHVTLLKGCE